MTETTHEFKLNYTADNNFATYYNLKQL